MGTAYASFTSLRNLITDLREHPYPPIKLYKKHVRSLNSNISFFRGFLEGHHETVEGGLEIRMADAAHAAEDLIETHIADRVPDFHGSLQRVIDCFDFIRKEVIEMNLNEQSQRNSQPKRHPAPSQSPSAIFDEDTVVGLEDVTSKTITRLTARSYLDGDNEVTAILGMAGIGKTTLARKVYGHPIIKEHFDVVAWAEIPMESTTEYILIELLLSLGVADNTESLLEESERGLREKLYDCLEGKEYLVVLDNVYDGEVWGRLSGFFRYGCGRVLITTSKLTVAHKSAYGHNVIQMDLLDEPKSWELFCKKVFGNDSCPSQLEDVGKKIARKCGGLPLSISVIGEHLAMSQRTEKYWEHVANNISSLVFSLHKGESLKRLSTSFARLPVPLKPCFLYMGIFPEDEEIEVYKLIRLWIAEGFINPIRGESLEKTGESYFDELIWRSLILPSKYSRRRRTLKGCKIHSLLRHLCIKEAVEKQFFYIALKLEDLRAVENERRIVRRHMESEGGHSLPYYNASRSRALRTFMFDGELSRLNDKKLLRVLAPVAGSSSFLLETLDTDELVNIRYLDPSVPFSQDIYRPPSSMTFRLWNLKYLFFNIRIDGEVPLDIWKMHQLRDVKMKELAVSRPPSESNDIIMKNLHSAQTLLNFNFSTEVIERIPNIEKLKVRYDHRAVAHDEFLNGINRLEKLESLGCFFDLSSSFFVRIRNVNFPESLFKLNFSHLRWEDVTDKLGSLRNLRVLKLHHCEGSEWELVEGQFLKLRFLQLSHCRSLRYFKAHNTHFPFLERLVMERLDHLEGLNLDIELLGSIEVYSCPDSAVISAIESADLQSRRGHNVVEVKVRLLKESALSDSLISTDYARVHHIK